MLIIFFFKQMQSDEQNSMRWRVKVVDSLTSLSQKETFQRLKVSIQSDRKYLIILHCVIFCISIHMTQSDETKGEITVAVSNT
jgi:hypothetical protein